MYIYRLANFVGSGVSYDVYADDIYVRRSYNDRYFSYFANPRSTRFWANTEAESSVTVDVIEGQRY